MFSYRTRETALSRFQEEKFDLLIIGGGITGAATARDAVSRGLKVALVERNDFASGTSSRSSKLIHGGLRYLENFEFHLVFEALAERSFLLKSAPHMVRPLPFYLPVYEGDVHQKGILGLGLWLYDLLALFRAPGFHKRLSKEKFLEAIPALRKEGLTGGFSYYDASMWDDVLTVETLRAAHHGGAAVANYVEAVTPLWKADQIQGFRVKDRESGGEVDLYATRTVICAGPWTDQMGKMLTSHWKNWLTPSKGVHLVFDLKRIPLPGAMVMNHPKDGRISFVIPRPDYGAGVVIVGTTDGPSPTDPEKSEIEPDDVHYLMELLHQYFPELNLTTADIVSAYVGVRPLAGTATSTGATTSQNLQKVSREHFIGDGPGGTVIVAGGKYTTHRKMAVEVVDHALASWKKNARLGKISPPPVCGPSQTKTPINPHVSEASVGQVAHQIGADKKPLLDRYGAAVEAILEIDRQERVGIGRTAKADPDGFPLIRAQLIHTMRTEMVMHLEDFYLRRLPVVHSRGDHGLPWAEELAQIWARERNLPSGAAASELERLKATVARLEDFKNRL